MSPLHELGFDRFDEIRLPPDLDADSVRRWIQWVCRTLEITPTALAKRAQASPSNINRFLAGQDSNANLGARTIVKLFSAATSLNLERTRSTDPQSADHVDPDAFWLSSVQVAGIITADDRGSTINPLSAPFPLTVPLLGPYRRLTVAHLIDYDHPGQAFPRGSVVIGCEFDGPMIASGDRLLISRQDRAANRTEVSLRECLFSPNGDAWLASLDRSNDRTPDMYLGRVSEGSEIAWSPQLGWTIEYQIAATLRPEGPANNSLKSKPGANGAKKGLNIGAK
ncbi:hypothetical protein EDE08_10440 [Bradyrhizobium sp. R2.2-H]|jgi:hypothetical protein|uniref:hypothetical protein n=1 Tax=unclassified Bradyrhizobium TaxID=2631580 RepID=UPI00104FE54F|nr:MULTISPECIES: hypothetical protein [unclassified Bradyrhizobium]TCU73932.1 hypothetical protein EDE10_104602 [Bradyrhizobium sp. Y-H1]TCU75878.1 hypothetical protein EDE08_10440 [Bradyrhizobium sp. R2.2-H]